MRRQILILVSLASGGCSRGPIPVIVIPTVPSSNAAKIVTAARSELVYNTQYDASYQQIKYPMGDVPLDRGACTDVVIRAIRPLGLDLQKLVHEDIVKEPDAYPNYAGQNGPDTNIDHRRVPNLRIFFARQGCSLPLSNWRPGDLITWKTFLNRDHIGIITDHLGPSGQPMVIHNIGTVAEEDVLDKWEKSGHYRYPK